jgi:hypothetical protein
MNLDKAVFVQWIDSTHGGGWNSISTHRSSCHLGPMVSIGFVVQETETHLLLAQSQSVPEEDCANTLAIPKVAITHIEVIEQEYTPKEYRMSR